MSTSLAYHTQGIVGFQHHSFQYSEGKVIQRLKRKEFRCPKCFHCSVNAHHYRTRRIQGLPYGGMKVYFEVELHRIYCPRCRALSVEELPFLSHPKARITKALERTIIELRPEMTIHAISNYFHLDWRIVKACEKRYLKRKFRRIKLRIKERTATLSELFYFCCEGQKLKLKWLPWIWERLSSTG